MSVIVFGFAAHPYVLDIYLKPDLALALDHQRDPTQNPPLSNTHPPSSADNPHDTEFHVRGVFDEDAYRYWRCS